MYISLPLFGDMTVLSKSQARLMRDVAQSLDPTTNIGFISYERLTNSQAQRLREDARALVAMGYIRKYPMTRASTEMKTLQITHSRRINFYMANPIHMHALNTDAQGLKEIWQLLK